MENVPAVFSGNDLINLAEMVAKSQLVPAQYRGKPSDALVAMLMGRELGLNPIQALQSIAVINGKPSIYGDALVAIMQSHPAFGGMEEEFDDETMTATCTVWRKGGSRHTEKFSHADAKTAGLAGKSGPWTQYPKRMLMWRARGFAIRAQFADALAGLITREEAEDYPQERNITPPPPNSQRLDFAAPEDKPAPAPAAALASARKPVEAPPPPAATQARKPAATLFGVDGKPVSEHASPRAFLDALETLAVSAGQTLGTVILGHNDAVLQRIGALGVFDERILRIRAAIATAAAPADAAPQDDIF